ncbi:ABC transporter substrate-binding protein [Fluviibacterium sp. DFM31]|uniref:ABC transporter substrate-binding protein n=1 Tax=Meridianimarinicoccus marinus TaxID=3231483 RepID=A0ABV3L9F3_9RHOB
MQGEKIDDYAVKLTFAAPYGAFLTELATPLAQEPVLLAEHYCKQYLSKYNPDAQSQVEATEAVEDWPSLFRLNCGEVEAPNRWANSERPTQGSWVITGNRHSVVTTPVTTARTPYFWQVNTVRCLLRYVDELLWGIVQDAQAILLEAIAGNVDMQSRRINNPANKPVPSQNMERGGYKIHDGLPANSNIMAIHFKHTLKGPAMRDVLRNKDVRSAPSLGIDRD